MARTTWRKDTDADNLRPEDYPQDSACQLCIKSDANLTREAAMRRLTHYLEMARDYGCDALRSHLADYLGQWYATDQDRAKAVAQSHMGWVWDQINTYGGLVDEQTGPTLSWYDGRQKALAAIHDYYRRSSAEAKARVEAEESRIWIASQPKMIPEPPEHAGIAGQIVFDNDDPWLEDSAEEDGQTVIEITGEIENTARGIEPPVYAQSDDSEYRMEP